MNVEWMSAWKKYVDIEPGEDSNSAEHPGPLDTSNLFAGVWREGREREGGRGLGLKSCLLLTCGGSGGRDGGKEGGREGGRID